MYLSTGGGFKFPIRGFALLDAAGCGKVAELAALCRAAAESAKSLFLQELAHEKKRTENLSIHDHPFRAMMVNRKGPSGHETAILSRPGVIREQKAVRRVYMSFVAIMWIVWGVLVLLMGVFHLYRSSLEKNEDDQIFLDESFDHEQSEQLKIASKVQKMEPWLRVSQWLAAAMTAFVILYYIWYILKTFDIIGS
jgi:hypothetical protein